MLISDNSRMGFLIITETFLCQTLNVQCKTLIGLRAVVQLESYIITYQ